MRYHGVRWLIVSALLTLPAARALAAPQLNASEFCGVVSNAELAALLKPSKNLTGGPVFTLYFLCSWSMDEKTKEPALSMQVVPAPAGHSAKETFNKGRAEALEMASKAQANGSAQLFRIVVHTRDESGIGEAAYSTSQSGFLPSTATFTVFEQGSILTFQMPNSTDVDGLRPIVAKLSAAYPRLSESGKNPGRICSAVQPGDLTALFKLSAPPKGGATVPPVGSICSWTSVEGHNIATLQVMASGPESGLTAGQTFDHLRSGPVKEADLHARDENAIGDRAFSTSIPVSATFTVLTRGVILTFRVTISNGGADVAALRPVVKSLVAAY